MEKTKIVNIKYSDYDVYIGRPGKGKMGYFGNPIKKGQVCPICGSLHLDNGSTIECYKKYFYNRLENDEKFRKAVLSLKGKVLGCFCKPNFCHGDIIIEWLEGNS